MDPALRIIDANLNRCREGWRVMEDVARFALNHADLSEKVKTLRHDLAGATRLAGLDAALLASGRDAAADVGTAIKTPAELSRSSLRDAVIAAGNRAGEALRSIEEAVKVRSGPSHLFERLRYRHYDVERDLVLAMGSGRACRQWRVCVLITEALCTRLPWDEVARLARLGGADCLQLREKGLPDRELLRRAKVLVEIGHEYLPPHPRAEYDTQPTPPASVIINDRPDIALLAGADGVHLGVHDLPVREARRIVGERLWIGASTHTEFEAREAVSAGADYVGVGAMFETATKREQVSGPAFMRWMSSGEGFPGVPALAIGGITIANVAQVVQAGARGVAVSSVVCASDQPGAVVAELRSAIGAALPGGGTSGAARE